MLKRVTKVTSLLIATTSIVSMVPAMGAEYPKVEAQEGTVRQGKSYGNDVFLIDGYKSENDDSAIYYVGDDGKFNKIDDIASGDTLGDKLQEQYAEIGDKQDTYVALKDGFKVVDDNVRETMVDDAARKVKNKIKHDNDGRFDEDYYKNSVVAEPKSSGATSTFFNGCFGTWSHYKYKLKDLRISDELNGDTESYSTIYSDLDGNYFDGDYNLGSLKVAMTSATTSASVTIKNTKDTYDITEDGVEYELKAEIKENKVLVEGYGDINRLADLTIYRKVKGASDDTYEPATSDLYFGGRKNKHKVTNGDSVTVLQKFSKEQASDSIDGLKYPKNSDIYFITDEDGVDETLLGLADASTIGSKTGSADAGFGIVSTSAKGTTSFYVDLQNSKVYAETLNLKKKDEYNYVSTSDYKELDLESTDAWTIGGGDLWCVSDGYIETWDETKNDFEKEYGVDNSMDKISVNDADNAIVWNEDKGIYSIVYNKTKTEEAKTTTESTSTTTGAAATTTGWVKNSDRTWTYVKADGTMATGWINDTGTWYYLNASGSMQTGWINDNGTWYYCNISGAMLANTTIDGYVLGANGAWTR